MEQTTFDQFQEYFKYPNSFTVERKDRRCSVVDENGHLSITKRTIYQKEDPRVDNMDFSAFVIFNAITITKSSAQLRRDPRKFSFEIGDSFLCLGKHVDSTQRYIMHKTGGQKCSPNCKCTERRTDVPTDCFRITSKLSTQGPFRVISFGFMRRTRQPPGFKQKSPPDSIAVELDVDGHYTFFEQSLILALEKTNLINNECLKIGVNVRDRTVLPENSNYSIIIKELNLNYRFSDITHCRISSAEWSADLRSKKPVKENTTVGFDSAWYVDEDFKRAPIENSHDFDKQKIIADRYNESDEDRKPKRCRRRRIFEKEKEQLPPKEKPQKKPKKNVSSLQEYAQAMLSPEKTQNTFEPHSTLSPSFEFIDLEPQYQKDLHSNIMDPFHVENFTELSSPSYSPLIRAIDDPFVLPKNDIIQTLQVQLLNQPLHMQNNHNPLTNSSTDSRAIF